MKIEDLLIEDEQVDEIFNPTSAVSKVLRYLGRKLAQIFPWLAVGGTVGALGVSGVLAPAMAVAGGMAASITAIGMEAGLMAGAAGMYAAPSILQTIKDLFAADENSIQAGIKKWVEKHVGDEADVQEFLLTHAKAAYESKSDFRWRAKDWPVKLSRDQAEAHLEKNDKYWLDTEKQKVKDAETAKSEKPDTIPDPQKSTSTQTAPRQPAESIAYFRNLVSEMDAPASGDKEMSKEEWDSKFKNNPEVKIINPLRMMPKDGSYFNLATQNGQAVGVSKGSMLGRSAFGPELHAVFAAPKTVDQVLKDLNLEKFGGSSTALIPSAPTRTERPQPTQKPEPGRVLRQPMALRK